MKSPGISKPLMSICCAFFLISCVACQTVGGGFVVGHNPPPPARPDSSAAWHGKSGPPSHAPAHGYRAKHNYRYYQDVEIYFDIGRDLYFYQEGGSWSVSAQLPKHLRVRLGDYVTISMDTDRPYKKHKHHKNKYPPGQMKKKNKKNNWTSFLMK